jgi:small ligand-binding sensory domain FIST
MTLQLELIKIELKSLSLIQILLKRNGMQIDGKGIELFFCGYGIGKKHYEKTHFNSSLLGNWLNEFVSLCWFEN